MKSPRPLGAFKKDLRRLARRGYKLEKLYYVISSLRQNSELPPIARPHKLGGAYDGLWECHIESNWLLIYNITDTEIVLHRTGSHDDLFD